jgi:outer membrane protein assembly factor BamE (lipoprotein component of BamABCDE complex)
MPRTIVLFLVAITALLAGCATQQDRIEHIRSQYPQLDQESVQLLAQKQIRVGMTEEMVTTAKGRPRFNYHQDGTEVWEYVEYMGGEMSGAYIVRSSCTVYFQNKKVVDIQGDC